MRDTLAHMRTTLTLDPDVYRAAVALAHRSGRRLGQVVSELARRGLSPAASGTTVNATSGLPQFGIAAAAETLRASEIQKYLDEEGWF